MRPSTRMRTRLALIGLILMWLASIEREPGGLTAFAGELESVEQGIGAATARLDSSIERGSQSHVVEFMDGVVCERDPATHKVLDDHCHTFAEPDFED